jgi:hypothetical protein
LRDIADSDLRCSAGAFSDARRLKEPKPPDEGFEREDENEDEDLDEDDEDDERCDENPLLKDEEPDGFASAGIEASGRIRHSASATCAYFEMVFSMVRSAGES